MTLIMYHIIVLFFNIFDMSLIITDMERYIMLIMNIMYKVQVTAHKAHVAF